VHYEYYQLLEQEYQNILHHIQFEMVVNQLTNVSNEVELFYFEHFRLLHSLFVLRLGQQYHHHQKHNHRQVLEQEFQV
jgi:hypothetical protein